MQMATQSKLSRAVRYALYAGAATMISGGLASAQETTQTLDRIEVTGSRIKRADAETSQPVFTLSREEIKAQGLTSVGDVIQNLTANGSTLNTTQNNGGNGETRVSLRNLGSNRTLVLVNGRRWVPGTGLGGATDLNTIPTAAVERIEVLKDGASVIYGSDAIAGVVNVILRQDFEGAEANAYYGEFDEGDGTRYSADVTIGARGDRWAAMMGAGQVTEDPVFAGDRDISAIPVFGTTPFFGASSTTPNGQFGFGANGALGPTGTTGRITNDGPGTPFRPFAATDNYNFAPDNYLITPQERISLFSRAHIDITDTVRFVMSGVYNERASSQLLAATPLVGGVPGGGLSNGLRISANSLFNPFGQTITWIQRRVTETGGRRFAQDNDTFGFQGVFEGSFDLGDRFFSWDAGYLYADNESITRTDGLLNVAALNQALGPSELRNGVPTCVVAPGGAAIAGCVPLNLLGGVGSITPAMLGFSSFIAFDQRGYTLKDYFANISGEIVQLPGGPLAFAFGVEAREESGFDQPDALINSGNTTGNARRATRGSYNLDEAYLEFQVPVLADMAFAEILEISVASRYSDYSNFGDTTNSKVGFRWKPISDVLVRGNFSEGFRAPSIAELFAGQGDSFPPISDPCARSIAGANVNNFASLSAAAQARCLADGVPAGGYAQPNSQIRITTGGNPNLGPESSETTTLGLVYSPSFVEGVDVALDWYKIELENVVSARSAQGLLDDCYTNTVEASCIQGGITRANGGLVTDILQSQFNLAALEVEGYDLTVNYRMPETDYGNFSFTWDTTYLDTYIFNNDGNNLAGEYSDRNNNWRIRSNLMTRWNYGDFSATWFMRFYSKQDEPCTAVQGSPTFRTLCSDSNRIVNNAAGVPVFSRENRLGGTTYSDVTAAWQTPWNSKITLGVNNALDKDAPTSYSTFANSFDPQYEIPGRFYYMQYSQKF